MTVILTDVDGVLLNWEYAFKTWMKHHGYDLVKGHEHTYEMHLRYGISAQEKSKLIKHFNESAAIGFLPPLRDAVHYVQKLHREHGYVFHVITSLSLDPNAQRLRTMNLQKLFGETVFERFVYLDTGADKDEALAEYKGSHLLWVEDKTENALCGKNLGLDSVLIEHGHNMTVTDVPLMKNWKDVYQYEVGI
jgi:phosphoglycolate phosphatase-like HAD superfamily hydrolase